MITKLNHRQLIRHLSECIINGTLVYYEALRIYHSRYPLSIVPVDFIRAINA